MKEDLFDLTEQEAKFYNEKMGIAEIEVPAMLIKNAQVFSLVFKYKHFVY